MSTKKSERGRGQKLTDYICDVCRVANREGKTHPGQFHMPGICDCKCRDE